LVDPILVGNLDFGIPWLYDASKKFIKNFQVSFHFWWMMLLVCYLWIVIGVVHDYGLVLVSMLAICPPCIAHTRKKHYRKIPLLISRYQFSPNEEQPSSVFLVWIEPELTRSDSKWCGSDNNLWFQTLKLWTCCTWGILFKWWNFKLWNSKNKMPYYFEVF
jgi:hypothetical protein